MNKPRTKHKPAVDPEILDDLSRRLKDLRAHVKDLESLFKEKKIFENTLLLHAFAVRHHASKQKQVH
jgi:hypothetical protein